MLYAYDPQYVGLPRGHALLHDGHRPLSVVDRRRDRHRGLRVLLLRLLDGVLNLSGLHLRGFQLRRLFGRVVAELKVRDDRAREADEDDAAENEVLLAIARG